MPACSPPGMLGLQPTIGSTLIMPSFVAIIIGGLGSLPGTLVGRPADRRRLGHHDGILSVGLRGGHLRDDGGWSCWSGRAACLGEEGRF